VGMCGGGGGGDKREQSQNPRSGPKVKPRCRRADFPGAAADWLGRQAKQLRTAERHRPFVLSFQAASKLQARIFHQSVLPYQTNLIFF
jgi:hypothetical protein